MRTVMRPRYYCDHCKKGSGSPSHMKRHESGCTLNPNRVCGMCALMVEAGGEASAPPDELRRVLKAEGFYAMRQAANDCPACILTIIRHLNDVDPETGFPTIAFEGEWKYREAKKDWWDEFNSTDCRNYPV